MKKKSIIDRIIDDGIVTEGTTIVVGVSGGPDSLCLLHALAKLSDTLDLTLVPVHVNHKLRPEADREADNVARICDKLGLECEMFEVDCSELAEAMKVSTEEAGRIARYDIFDEVARAVEETDGIPSERINIAVAHNADDQSETVLFRLIRGTGLHGLSGMQPVRNSEAGYMLIRPLLDIERSEIEEYIRVNKLHPNIDPSNASTDYTRNKIRNELIPYLEKNYNPNIKQTLRRFAETAGMDDSLLSEIAFSTMMSHFVVDPDHDEVMLDLKELKNHPPAIVSRVISFVLQTLRQEGNASYELIVSLMGMVYSDNPSGSLDLPGGFRSYREYDTLIFADASAERIIKPDANLRLFPQIMMKKDFVPDEEGMYAAFDFDKFNEAYPGKVGEIVLRTRQEGDYLPMKRGRKKIQDLLVDSKVVKNARDSILMVAIEHEILWVLPSDYFGGKNEREKGRFSPKYNISEETERILYIEIAENI